MGKHKRYCRNILKQYGKNIKKFDERIENPLDMIRVAKTLRNSNIWERRIAMPFCIIRGSRKLNGYNDYVKYSK